MVGSVSRDEKFRDFGPSTRRLDTEKLLRSLWDIPTCVLPTQRRVEKVFLRFIALIHEMDVIVTGKKKIGYFFIIHF